MGMRSLSHMNIESVVQFFVRFLTLIRSDDGLAYALKLVTKKKSVICVVQDCILNTYNLTKVPQRCHLKTEN